MLFLPNFVSTLYNSEKCIFASISAPQIAKKMKKVYKSSQKQGTLSKVGTLRQA